MVMDCEFGVQKKKKRRKSIFFCFFEFHSQFFFFLAGDFGCEIFEQGGTLVICSIF
jgi:hypothetical protein